MSATDHVDLAAAEFLYKQLLRRERAAWDALFARPPGSHAFGLWRRMTAEANRARSAFLQPSIGSDDMTGFTQPENHALLKQVLKDAIQRQKLAWTALEQSLRSGRGEDPDLRAAWIEAIRRVRAARKRLHAQEAAAPRATP